LNFGRSGTVEGPSWARKRRKSKVKETTIPKILAQSEKKNWWIREGKKSRHNQMHQQEQNQGVGENATWP